MNDHLFRVNDMASPYTGSSRNEAFTEFDTATSRGIALTPKPHLLCVPRHKTKHINTAATTASPF